MKKPSIVFMGTPDFAVYILEVLIQKDYNVVGVVTAPDKPAGRGKKMKASAVKLYALSASLPVLQPRNLKDPDFLNQLASLNADLQVVVAFRMLPRAVWSMPTLGTFNLHASLLPDYRGAAPIHWSIINGETKTGVTTFFIDEKIDTGEIIANAEIPIAPDETVGELHDRLMHIGAQLVCETVNLIVKGNYKTKKQPHDNVKMAPKLNSENTRIKWENSVDRVYNQIRGLNPFPAAWTNIKNGQNEISAKVYGIDKELVDHQYATGTLLTDRKSLKVAVKDGFIIIKEIKLSGKKKMDSKSLLNGFQFQENAMAL